MDKIKPEKNNEMKIGNLPEKGFRIMIMNIIQDLGKIMNKMQEMFTNNLEELKNKQTEVNNTLEGINSRIEAKEQKNDLENRMAEITATEQNIAERMKRNEDTLRDLWDNIKHNIHIIRVSEGEEREKRHEKLFEEIIAKNFPNMGKEIANQIQEAQRVPSRINPRRNPLRHIVIKLAKIKDKDKILKSTREK